MFGGGIIPDDDIAELPGWAWPGSSPPGAPTSDIVAWVRAELGHEAAESQA